MAGILAAMAGITLIVRARADSAMPADRAAAVTRIHRVAEKLETLRRRHLSSLRRQREDAPVALEREIEYEKLLANPVNIKGELNAGDRKWESTVLRFEDLFFAKERRIECGQLFGQEIEKICHYEVGMAIERTSPNEGKIVRVRGTVVGDQPEPLCQAFADCIADARSGLTVPLPDDPRERYGLVQKLQSSHPPKQMRDARFVQNMVDELHSLKEQVMKGPNHMDPDSYQYKSGLQKLAYFERYAAELREREGK